MPLTAPLPDTSETALVIPKGTIVVIPVNVLQTDPDFWGKDGDAFRPQRWLENDRADLLKGRDLLAFSMGYVQFISIHITGQSVCGRRLLTLRPLLGRDPASDEISP